MGKNSANHSLQVILTTASDDERPVFLSGNFNKWQTRQEEFQMQRVAPGRYSFNFLKEVPLSFPLEYKYLKGDWQDEELDHFGHKIKNRILPRPNGIVKDHVPRWSRGGKAYQSKFLPKPHILTQQFEIPQLIKTRRISALLPHDYFDTDKRYPVLYLQDGQNLFDEHAPFGSWEVTKKLAVMAERGIGDIIIIAIDHAEEERIEEFTPSRQTQLGVGDGKKYVRFLADTLKPHIDNNFRTLPEAKHTGIGGSSMGGLISLYAGMMYPEVYSKWMIFSPSLWVAPDLPINSVEVYKHFDQRIYLYAGAKESQKLVGRMRLLKKTLSKNIAPGIKGEIKLSINPEGHHNEYNWGIEFPKAVEWLFFNQNNTHQ